MSIIQGFAMSDSIIMAADNLATDLKGSHYDTQKVHCYNQFTEGNILIGVGGMINFIDKCLYTINNLDENTTHNQFLTILQKTAQTNLNISENLIGGFMIGFFLMNEPHLYILQHNNDFQPEKAPLNTFVYLSPFSITLNQKFDQEYNAEFDRLTKMDDSDVIRILLGFHKWFAEKDNYKTIGKTGDLFILGPDSKPDIKKYNIS